MSTGFKRHYEERKERPCIFVFTEGTVTEPAYFRALKSDLRLSSLDIQVVGTGFNTLSLVDHVIEVVKKIPLDREIGDEVWVVFDRDDFEANFNNAINKAKAHGIHVAYSNECFELWFLLHFELYSADNGRKEYFNKLGERLKVYTKNKIKDYEKNCTDMYWMLLPLQASAIKRSKTLLETHADPDDFVKNCPSTTVHDLVVRLNDLNSASEIGLTN